MLNNSMFYPLAYFYEKLRLPVPNLRQAEPSELPEPENGLLVHDRDMTPTLEAAHGGKLKLRVLQFAATNEAVNRLVALLMDGVPKPLGIGAIHIFTNRLPTAARELVLDREEPFGRILQETGVAHYSRPTAYFDVTADPVIMEALGMPAPRVLYGRRNTIWNTSGEVLADVVEILAPSKTVNKGVCLESTL